MYEIVSEAFVLDREDVGESDSRVILFTKDWGRVSAKMTSGRKITSKLAPHLQPLNYVLTRLVAKKDFFDYSGLHCADAVSLESGKKIKDDPEKLKKILPTIQLLTKLLPRGARENEFWELLRHAAFEGEEFGVNEVFRLLGLDLEYAHCVFCQKKNPRYFQISQEAFFCQPCVSGNQDLNGDFIFLKEYEK